MEWYQTLLKHQRGLRGLRELRKLEGLKLLEEVEGGQLNAIKRY